MGGTYGVWSLSFENGPSRSIPIFFYGPQCRLPTPDEVIRYSRSTNIHRSIPRRSCWRAKLQEVRPPKQSGYTTVPSKSFSLILALCRYNITRHTSLNCEQSDAFGKLLRAASGGQRQLYPHCPTSFDIKGSSQEFVSINVSTSSSGRQCQGIAAMVALYMARRVR
jgi:hypothetical protein